MKLELKGIQVNARRSGETVCFVATLWVDGQPVGDIGNHGRGGEDFYTIDKGTLAGVNAWIANNETPRDPGVEVHNLTTWCAEQIDAHIEGVAA